MQTPNQSQRTPTSSWPTYSFPAPIASNQGMSDSFHSSAPLPDFESMSNIGDGGWIPCYSKLWIDNLCLFSFESESEVTQSCPTLCDPMDCSLSGSSVRGIFQARVLEWIAISFSRGSSQPRDWTRVSWVFCIGRWILYHWANREALISSVLLFNYIFF